MGRGSGSEPALARTGIVLAVRLAVLGRSRLARLVTEAGLDVLPFTGPP